MLTYEDYEMLSDFIGWLGSPFQYKFVVKLAKKDKNGNRDGFHKEYMYKSNYNSVDMICSIKRSFDYYITIENNNGVYIQIRPQNMIMLQNIANQISGYLFNEAYWAIKSKKLVIKGKPQPLFIYNLPMGKWMSFEIIVIEYNGEFDKGVRIAFSDGNQFTDVRIDTFMEFLYFINSFNMYQAALEIVNYLGRPAFGTNMVTFEDRPEQYNRGNNPNYEGDAYAKGSRVIEPKQQRSFFSKVDKLTE